MGKKREVAEQPKRFTPINKADEVGCFDVDSTGWLAGTISPLLPTSGDWKLAVDVAEFAALKQAEDGGLPIQYKQLVKVNIEPVAGIMYYLTFTAIDLTDQRRLEKIYRAKVWAKVDLSLELLCFEEFKDSKISAEEMRKNITATLKQIARLKSSRSIRQVRRYAAPRNDWESGVVFLNPKLGQLPAMGFTFLLKEMRSQNPHWKYARVRKAASKKWRSLHIGAKLPYIIKAEKKFQEMHHIKV